jgi:hypothetical protein
MIQVRWASTNGVKSDWFCPRGGWICARNQVGFGIRGGLFGYFLPIQKVTKEISKSAIVIKWDVPTLIIKIKYLYYQIMIGRKRINLPKIYFGTIPNI